jgi:hypothetical protein
LWRPCSSHGSDAALVADLAIDAEMQISMNSVVVLALHGMYVRCGMYRSDRSKLNCRSTLFLFLIDSLYA